MVTSALVLSPSGPWTGCKMMSKRTMTHQSSIAAAPSGQWQRTTPAKCKNLNALHGTLQVASFIVCHRQTRTSSCKARQGQAPRPRALLFQTWLAVLAVPDPVPWEKKCQESRSTATRPWSTAGLSDSATALVALRFRDLLRQPRRLVSSSSASAKFKSSLSSSVSSLDLLSS